MGTSEIQTHTNAEKNYCGRGAVVKSLFPKAWQVKSSQLKKITSFAATRLKKKTFLPLFHQVEISKVCFSLFLYFTDLFFKSDSY